MKIFSLITTPVLCLILSLTLVGCGIPDGDFWGDQAMIVSKKQDYFDKEKKQARFKIAFRNGNYVQRWYIMPENFGEVGDVIKVTNKTLYAESPE